MRWRYVAVAVAVIFIILVALFPHALYDNFLWKYIIGPVVADATGKPVQHNGVYAYEGYTPVSEAIYGILMVLFIYLTYLFFERNGIVVDLRFLLLSIPFMLYGSMARVMEDAGIFSRPLSYFFISPFIYVQIGILFVFSLLYGIRFRGKRAFMLLMLAAIALYTFLYIFLLSSPYALHPAIFAILSLIALWIYGKMEDGYLSSMFSIGFLCFSSSLLSLILFAIKGANLFPAILITPLLAALVAMLLYFLGIRFNFSLLGNRINFTLIFGHMLDAITTYFAVVNPFKWKINYGEKHPLPDFLMKSFYGVGYPVLKFLVILGVIYVVDDLKKNLKNTIKFFILFLGLSPGIRDVLRILLGV